MTNVETQMEKVLLDAAIYLDRRAATASSIAAVVFLASVFWWALAVPFLFLPQLPASTLTTVVTLLVLGLILSAGLAVGVVRALGGEVSELRDVAGDFSSDGIKIGDQWVKAAVDFRSIKVNRYKGGCGYVVVRQKCGGELRIFPSGKGMAAHVHKDDYCRLCEHIRAVLTGPQVSPGQ